MFNIVAMKIDAEYHETQTRGKRQICIFNGLGNI